MKIDYDQLLAKRPKAPDSVFAWHQDSAYWPPLAFDPATCTCWLAIDDSTVAERVHEVPPGQQPRGGDPETRSGEASKGRMDEESSHALATTLSPADEKASVRTRGDQARGHHRHDQRVVHGSGPNNSEGWRRAYVLAFRTKEMVEEERLGFFALAQRRVQLGRVSRLARRKV